MKTTKTLKVLSYTALILGAVACSDTNTAGGTSEEAEGIIAIANKTIEGVSQKGPFAIGSSVVLKETTGSTLVPTGKEFYATTRSEKGDFKIDGINLESPYVLLTAMGYYKRELNDQYSDCTIQLNAISNIENRETVNINLFTHFEYQRILNLVKAGVPFTDAKKQASKEVLAAFGFTHSDQDSEDLDITVEGQENAHLKTISNLLDNGLNLDWNRPITACSEVSILIENLANDIANDGILTDSIQSLILNRAYDHGYSAFTNHFSDYDSLIVRINSEAPSDSLDLYDRSRNEAVNIVKNYSGLGSCSSSETGTFVKLNRTIKANYRVIDTYRDPLDTTYLDYALCTGYNWNIISETQYRLATSKVEHEIGSVTDPRDGKTYRTTSFVHNQHKYEWMAENFGGIHAWKDVIKTEAYSETDSIYQGICPDNWHIPTPHDWSTLIEYVGSANGLKGSSWNAEGGSEAFRNFRKYLFKDVIEFNVAPDSSENQAYSAYYFAFSPKSKPHIPEAQGADIISDNKTLDNQDFYAIAFSFGEVLNSIETYNTEYLKGYIRCVKN